MAAHPTQGIYRKGSADVQDGRKWGAYRVGGRGLARLHAGDGYGLAHGDRGGGGDCGGRRSRMDLALAARSGRRGDRGRRGGNGGRRPHIGGRWRERRGRRRGHAWAGGGRGGRRRRRRGGGRRRRGGSVEVAGGDDSGIREGDGEVGGG